MGLLLEQVGLLVVSFWHVFLCPWTKVEESFNVQAVHDILYLGKNITSYDHMEFPGVVPRTFLGALSVATLSVPVKNVVDHVLGSASEKLYILIGARCILACLAWSGMVFFVHKSSSGLNRHVSSVFFVLTSFQFHAPFYMSRMLPNTFALVLTSLALGWWVEGKSPFLTIWTMTFAAIVFRCDAIILVGMVGIHMLWTRQVGVVRGLLYGACAVVFSLAVSVLVDSFFWQRWLWPEGEVLWFNTALNKSKEWGVSPVYWYFTSALPKMLHAAYPLSFVGAYLHPKARSMMFVAVGFVALYSLLAHKEVRFLFPTIPLWNLSASIAITEMFSSTRRGFVVSCIRVSILAGLALGVGVTCISSLASYTNYPGGAAMNALHHLTQHESLVRHDSPNRISVHIDTYAATNGVSRFLEKGQPYAYSKQEGLNMTQYKDLGFDYLINEHSEIPGFELAESVRGFDHIHLCGNGPVPAARCALAGRMPLSLEQSDRVFIHKKA